MENELKEFKSYEDICIMIQEEWDKYRTITNNEDAWSFKIWLINDILNKKLKQQDNDK